MPEFRWILLGFGIVLLLGIWWWGARRSRQAPGNSQMREFTATAVVSPPAHSLAPHVDSAVPSNTSDWGVPPFEPLSIRTADFDDAPHIDLSMTAHSEPFDDTLDLSNAEHLPAAPPVTAVAATTAAPTAMAPSVAIPSSRLGTARAISAAMPLPKISATPAPVASLEGSDRFNNVESEEPNVSERQRIVSVRVSAGDELWAGADLLAVLQDLGLAHGRYQVFHRKHSDGRTLFCAANLVDPGTFDPAAMPEEEYRGLTLFAVLPGPADPLQTVDALLATAEDIAQALQGSIQITKGVPATTQDVAKLRQDVARFQASMSG